MNPTPTIRKATGKPLGKRLRRATIILGIIGLLVWGLTLFFSVQQLNSPRTSLRANGFRLVDTSLHYNLGGFIAKENELESADRTGIPIALDDTPLPYLGRFYYTADGWTFQLSDNVAHPENRSYKTVLLPRCQLDKQDVEPGRKLNWSLLLGKEITFQTPERTGAVLTMKFDTTGGYPLVKLDHLPSVSINLMQTDKPYAVRIIDREAYTLSANDPQNILVLPSLNRPTPQEGIVTFTRQDGGNCLLLGLSGGSQTLTTDKPYFIWNDWTFELRGLITTGFRVWTYTYLALLLGIGLVMFRSFVNKDRNVVNMVESRVLRLAFVYFLFSVLSTLYINHYILAGVYERSWAMVYASVLFGWLLFLVLTKYTRAQRFWESYRALPFVISLADRLISFQRLNRNLQALIVKFILPAAVILLVIQFTTNERVPLPFLPRQMGLPLGFFIKLYVCYLLYQFRNQLFKGDLKAHVMLWGSLGCLVFKTGDFGSLLFCLISYPVSSQLFSNRVLLPNPWHLRSWWAYYRKKLPSQLRPKLYLTRLQILSVSVVAAVLIYVGASWSTTFGEKMFRFRMPYQRPDTEAFQNLRNGPKESQVKLLWAVDHLINEAPLGEGPTLRTSNFYTTWHTDYAFASGYQFGGWVFLGLFSLLACYLLYDTTFLLRGIRRVVNERLFEQMTDSEDEAKKEFLSRHVYLYFLAIFTLVQTLYPALACLNVLPLTGQAIPCLSISITESIYTPLLFVVLYIGTGRLLHYNHTFFPEEIPKEDKAVFFTEIVGQTYPPVYGFTVMCMLIIGFLFTLKYQLLDKSFLRQETYELRYQPSPNPILSDLLERSSNLVQNSTPAEEALLRVGDLMNDDPTLSRGRKQYLLDKVKRYVYRGAYQGRQDWVAIRLKNNQFTFSRDSAIVQRIHRDHAVANMNYYNYFDERAGNRFGDPSLWATTEIYELGGKLLVRNRNLPSGSLPAKLPDELVQQADNPQGILRYSSDTLYRVKYVNGIRRKVLIHEAVGEIDLSANTIDRDLQALINLTVAKFIASNPVSFSVGSVVIANHQTGAIRVAASYPYLPNTSAFQHQQLVATLRANDLISYADPQAPMNFAFADAKPGSTIKPITAAGVLHQRPAEAEKLYEGVDFQTFIRESKNGYAASQLRDAYTRQDFRESMQALFGIQVIENDTTLALIPYRQGRLPFSRMLYFNEQTLFNAARLNRPLTEGAGNPIFASAIGQGDVRSSLAFLVQSYARIKTRQQVDLNLYSSTSVLEPLDEDKELDRQFAPLYAGMTSVLVTGTGVAVGKKLKALRRPLSDYIAKTGTVQIPRSSRNSATHIILCGPTHTIGVMVLGNLPDRNIDQHAKGLLIRLLPLLNQWNEGYYLH